MISCSNVEKFKNKRWGRFYCSVKGGLIQVLNGRCIEFGCPKNNSRSNLSVIRRRLTAGKRLPLSKSELLKEGQFFVGFDKILNDPWWVE